MGDGLSGRHFRIAFGVLVALLVTGTIAFHSLTHESWMRALYRSVVTTSLAGLDVSPAGNGALAVTMLLVLGGVALFAYVAGTFAEALLGGRVTGAWAEKRRRRTIEHMRDHYIICGYGRVGRRVAAEFRDAGVSTSCSTSASARSLRPAPRASSSSRATAPTTAISRRPGSSARVGLVASADSDVDNLYLVLSARTARPELLIVARASTEDAARKLKLAGADRIVQPYQSAGREMANLMLKPQVTAFLDLVTSAAGPDLHFEEIQVTRSSGQAGKTIRDLRIRQVTGALIVAIRKQDGTFDTTPLPDAQLGDGDVVIAAGTLDELHALETVFAPGEPVAG